MVPTWARSSSVPWSPKTRSRFISTYATEVNHSRSWLARMPRPFLTFEGRSLWTEWPQMPRSAGALRRQRSTQQFSHQDRKL